MRWFVQGMSLLAGRRVHPFASCVWNKIHFQHHLHRDVHDEIWRQVGSLWRAAIVLTRNLVSVGANVFQYTISEFPFVSVQKRVLVRDHSCENVGPTSSFSCTSNFFQAVNSLDPNGWWISQGMLYWCLSSTTVNVILALRFSLAEERS